MKPVAGWLVFFAYLTLTSASDVNANCTTGEVSSGAHGQVYHDLEQLAFIWAGVLLCNWLAKLSGITNILFHLIFGCICVNTGVLPEKPSQFLATFSEVAIIIIMFSLGLEENVRNFIMGIKKSWGIALIGAIGPFLTGYLITLAFFQSQTVALMSGLCMTATAVSLTMVSLKGLGLSKSKASVGIMTSAVLDDIGSLALVAITVPLVASDGGVDATSIVIIIAKALGFFVLVSIFGKFIFPERVRLNWCCRRDKFIYKWGFRSLMRFDPRQGTLVILLTGFGFGHLAHALGFHPGIGAYMGGLILKEQYFQDSTPGQREREISERIIRARFASSPRTSLESSPSEATHLIHIAATERDRTSSMSADRNRSSSMSTERNRTSSMSENNEHNHVHEDGESFHAISHSIDNLAISWVGPIFFVMLGTKLVLVPEVVMASLVKVITLWIAMLFGQFFSAFVGARYVPGGFNFVECVMIAFGMLGRAELAFVVLDIAYVSHQVITRECFYVLLFTCFLLNLTVPLVITWWKPYYLGVKKLPFIMKEPQKGGMDMGVVSASAANLQYVPSTPGLKKSRSPSFPAASPPKHESVDSFNLELVLAGPEATPSKQGIESQTASSTPPLSSEVSQNSLRVV